MTYPATACSLSTRLLRRSMALCFIGAIVLVYSVTWMFGYDHPQCLSALNLYWALGLLVSLLLIPWTVSRLRGPCLPTILGTPLEYHLAHYAYLSLYALILVMPLISYVGTRLLTGSGLFVVFGFEDIAPFAWISQTWNPSWETFEKPFDAAHRVTGLWLNTSVALPHAPAVGCYQWAHRDGTLERMPGCR